MRPEPDDPDLGPPLIAVEPTDPAPATKSVVEPRTIHRIGGASVANLRLKPRETTLDPPGISVIKAATPGEAAQEVRAGLPKAKNLHEQSKIIGSATVSAIEHAGFGVVAASSLVLPNHHRIIHPEGAAGFNDENLKRLAEAFVNTTGH